MRVYIPGTVGLLRSALAAGAVQPTRGLAFAVTAPLRAEYAAADVEELEYLAMADAATASLRLLARGDEPPLRVVISADVVDAQPRPDLERAVVELAGQVRWRDVAAVHVDGADAEGVVRAAAEAVDAADIGDLDADLVVGAAQDIDLAWYSPAEIQYLLVDLATDMDA